MERKKFATKYIYKICHRAVYQSYMFTIYKRDWKKTSYILYTPILILTFANAKSPVSMLETGLFSSQELTQFHQISIKVIS